MNPLNSNDLRELLLRRIVATVIGAILGIDRDIHKKPAGLRVLALVSLGASLVTVCTVAAVSEEGTNPIEATTKVVQGIIGGIGILGGGVTLRGARSEEVHGQTTATSSWFSAGLGTSCGLGHWRVATIGSSWR
jgi:putative Mg2+ transporter-C (MgtC) family protein